MFKVKIAVVVILLALLLMVALQNSDVITLQFLAWETGISLVALVFLAGGAGLVVGYLLGRLGGGAPGRPRS